MKGFTVSVIMATILFVFAIGLILMVQTIYYSDFRGIMKIPVENMEVVESAHAVESCLARLSANERFISKDVLEEYKGDSVNRICEIQEPVIEAELEDMESGDEYSFPPPSSERLRYLFPPAALVSDFAEAIRRWAKKDIKTEHSIWVSIAVPEVKMVTDENFELTGEFLVQARWEGLGIPVRNDVILKLYPEGYRGVSFAGMRTIQHYEVRQWLEDMERDGVKFDSVIVNFQNTTVKSITPYDLVDCGRMRILDPLRSESCVEIFERISEIHMGRLDVKI
jgi:hypothetical protein